MSKNLDEQYLDTRLKMREFDTLLATKELPEGVYMHNVTMRIDQRINYLLSEAWHEINVAASVVEAIALNKADV